MFPKKKGIFLDFPPYLEQDRLLRQSRANEVGKQRTKVAEEKQKDPEGLAEGMRSAAQAMMIPSIMVAAPVVGFFLGRWVGERFFDNPRAGGAVGLALGILAGVREVVKIIRRISKS